jgi:hypothetical protein
MTAPAVPRFTGTKQGVFSNDINVRRVNRAVNRLPVAARTAFQFLRQPSSLPIENERCWRWRFDGPRSPDGKARIVAAMVEEGRKWGERRHAEGGRFTAGRKGGSGWVTEAMRERARAEAHRLGGGRFTLDRALVLALLKSAKGDRLSEAIAKAMLDAQEQAEAGRDRSQALSVVRDLRARAMAGWSGGAPIPTTLPFAEGARPNAYAPAPYAPTALGGDPPLPPPSCSGISSSRSIASRKY